MKLSGQVLGAIKSKKSNFNYILGVTPKRVTSGGVHILSLAPGEHRALKKRRSSGESLAILSSI